MEDTEKKPREPVKPLTLDERVQRFIADPRPKRRKRLVHALNFAFGHALTLRGAVRKSRLVKLKQFEQHVPGYKIPAKAQEALDAYEQKENARA